MAGELRNGAGSGNRPCEVDTVAAARACGDRRTFVAVEHAIAIEVDPPREGRRTHAGDIVDDVRSTSGPERRRHVRVPGAERPGGLRQRIDIRTADGTVGILVRDHGGPEPDAVGPYRKIGRIVVVHADDRGAAAPVRIQQVRRIAVRGGNRLREFDLDHRAHRDRGDASAFGDDPRGRGAVDESHQRRAAARKRRVRRGLAMRGGTGEAHLLGRSGQDLHTRTGTALRDLVDDAEKSAVREPGRDILVLTARLAIGENKPSQGKRRPSDRGGTIDVELHGGSRFGAQTDRKRVRIPADPHAIAGIVASDIVQLVQTVSAPVSGSVDIQRTGAPGRQRIAESAGDVQTIRGGGRRVDVEAARDRLACEDILPVRPPVDPEDAVAVQPSAACRVLRLGRGERQSEEHRRDESHSVSSKHRKNLFFSGHRRHGRFRFSRAIKRRFSSPGSSKSEATGSPSPANPVRDASSRASDEPMTARIAKHESRHRESATRSDACGVPCVVR